MEDNLNTQIEVIKTGLEAKFDKLTGDLEVMRKEQVSVAQLDKINDSLKEQGEKITDFNEKHETAKGKFFHEQLKSFLTANKDKLKDTFEKGNGTITFQPDQEEIDKAVGDVMRANGAIGTVPAWNDVSLPNVMLRDDNPMLSFAKNYRTNSASQPFTEITGWEGNAAAVAEGGLKPQVDFDWITNYATPYKVAAWESLSEEVVTDIPRMMGTAKDFLKQKHDLKKVDLVYFGNGTSPNPEGATVYSSAFAAVASLTAKVATPNIMDIINAAILSVWMNPGITDGVPYQPNLVMLNPGDFALNFVMAKDNNGYPLFPQAGMFQKVKIGGVTIVPWIKIPAGKIFVADMKLYNLGNYVPYFIKIGWVNDQLIHNMFTIVGESRFYAFVKNYDQGAFLYDDIADIATSITKA